MTTASSSLDELFRTLANATRRAVVERLVQGPASVSELAEPFDMALPSFLEHLRVLEASELVDSVKQGRVRTYRLTPRALEPATDWLAAQRSRWERRLDRLDRYLEHMDEEEDDR